MPQASLYSFYNEYVKSTTINCPHTLGLRFLSTFSESR